MPAQYPLVEIAMKPVSQDVERDLMVVPFPVGRERPFHEHALDVRSYAMGMRQVSFHETARSYLPKRWFDAKLTHTHVALDDALEQGAMFCNMLAENRRPSEG